ncbi:hypothetical protein [Deinococcus maricopensis]|uniref:Uncharacterized protein n=1 Tax=Deinococcus maricopensis (strain DSM 21211 / LMG 22137 / NRRL B-23946 / LB-34) TaxID=709986 RepID=E8U586_DEIML|nr:hypothetical protein [Deinococcus maricopensis]ADV66225.1 hypothetical protein Deima_0566 [Deinococcus maricopensis DSM 21211]
MTFWRWLTTPDPSPGLNAAKLGKLLLKAFLFALVIVVIQALLRALGLKFVDTWWGSALLVIALYLPFARYLAVDMMPPARSTGAGAAGARKGGRVDARKFAGVKKGPPRQRR